MCRFKRVTSSRVGPGIGLIWVGLSLIACRSAVQSNPTLFATDRSGSGHVFASRAHVRPDLHIVTAHAEPVMGASGLQRCELVNHGRGQQILHMTITPNVDFAYVTLKLEGFVGAIDTAGGKRLGADKRIEEPWKAGVPRQVRSMPFAYERYVDFIRVTGIASPIEGGQEITVHAECEVR